MDVDDPVALSLFVIRRGNNQTEIEAHDNADGRTDGEPRCQHTTQSVDIGG